MSNTYQDKTIDDVNNYLQKKELLGVWFLRSFSNITKNGEIISWDGQLKGHLIYTDEGVVSVAINRFRDNKTGEIEHKCSFYTGKYNIIDNETIEHQIEECNEPDRIGTSHKRKVKLNKNLLELRGIGLTGEVCLLWERVFNK